MRSQGPESQSINNPNGTRAQRSQRDLNTLPGYVLLLVSILLARASVTAESLMGVSLGEVPTDQVRVQDLSEVDMEAGVEGGPSLWLREGHFCWYRSIPFV